MPAADGIRPFRFDVPQSDLDDLHRRLDLTRWSYGVLRDYLRDLVRHWRQAYGWRAADGRPGSVVEFLDVLGLLADPVAHGGDPADAFHVVVPGSGSGRRAGTGARRSPASWAPTPTC